MINRETKGENTGTRQGTEMCVGSKRERVEAETRRKKRGKKEI